MRKTLCAVLLAGAMCLRVYAATQGSVNGSIRGVVTDEQNAVLPGVTLTVSSPSVPRATQAISDPEGHYRLLELPPGTYTLTAELQGFAGHVRENIVVRVGLNLTVDVALKVGG